MGDRMGSSPIDRTKKMTCTFIVQVFFFCKGVRDLNGTLRKQHGALFLVPGVIATACGASPIDRTNRKDDIAIVFFFVL